MGSEAVHLQDVLDKLSKVTPVHDCGRATAAATKTCAATRAERFLYWVLTLNRLLEGERDAKFLAAMMSQPRANRPLSSEHFLVDSALISSPAFDAELQAE